MDMRPASRRLQRLQEIASDIQALADDDLSPLSKPRQVPSFRVPDDERKADAYLGQMRIEDASHSQSKGLKRAFTTNKKQAPYSYQELYSALFKVIDENGLVGVAEVLLNRFRGLGGDPNIARKAKTGVLKKVTNADTGNERGRLLQRATEQCRLDFVQILSPYADRASLDESLFIALERNQSAILEVLLQYGKPMFTQM